MNNTILKNMGYLEPLGLLSLNLAFNNIAFVS